MNKKKRLSVLCLTSLFSVLICLCTWLYLPFPIPFTMQTFAVFAALFCLGGKRGTLAILLYIFMGAVGLPVFSGFTSGVGALFGSTGGFLWGFLISGILYTCLEKISKHKLTNAFVSMLVCYCMGTLWFFILYSDKKGFGELFYTLCLCVFPFIIPDTIKILLAFYISKRVKKHLPK